MFVIPPMSEVEYSDLDVNDLDRPSIQCIVKFAACVSRQHSTSKRTAP
jgi:hypothetical protein